MAILTELVNFSESINLPARNYAESVVNWLIILNADGSLNRVEQLNTPQFDKKGQAKKPKLGQKITCPHIRRNAVQPKLITDTIEYVLGDSDKALAYRELLNKCYEITQESAVKAIINFITNNPEQQIADFFAKNPQLTNQNLDPKEVVTFQLDQEKDYIHDLPSVQQFWAEYVDELTGENRPTMQCLVTGKNTAVTTKFAFQIKGVAGANSQGASLISAYLDSCSSYNLEGALVSPISVDADEKISQALNYLIREENHHLNISNTTFVFWADSGKITRNFYEDPDAKEVKEYLELFQKPNQNINPDWQFNILGLSGNGGRIVVRDWIHCSEPDFAKNYQNWRKSQEVLGWDSFENRGHLGVWKLASAGYREAKEIQTRSVTALIRNAVYGTPLPIDLIQRVCHRNRIEQTVTYTRAVVLNMYVKNKGESMTKEEEIAFQYGRLLAVYGQLQRAAQNTDLANTNAMRCYATAGVSPIHLSHRLAAGAKNHLAEIEGGLAYWFTQRIAEINQNIVNLTENTDLPTVFSVNAQAHFDLGFWSELNYKKEEQSESN